MTDVMHTLPETIDLGTARHQALMRATSLAAEGRLLEAIAYATEQNLQVREPQLEYLLVKWRHQAFDPAAARGRADWPPSVPDLFADADGPPEVTADRLTP